HTVAEHDADPVALHSSAEVAERLVAVVELHPEHPAAQSLRDLALELHLLALTADCRSVPKRKGAAAAKPRRSRTSYATGTTLVASGPFEPSRCSNDTRAPSTSDLKPSPAMLLWCTNRSFEPSSGLMKPYPLLSLNHLTVPFAMKKHLPLTTSRTGEEGAKTQTELALISHNRSRRSPHPSDQKPHGARRSRKHALSNGDASAERSSLPTSPSRATDSIVPQKIEFTNPTRSGEQVISCPCCSTRTLGSPSRSVRASADARELSSGRETVVPAQGNCCNS